jgi:hypothetical protein
LVATQWVVAEIGPDGLDRKIWTKSGPDLDAVWTGFSKIRLFNQKGTLFDLAGTKNSVRTDVVRFWQMF